MSAPFAMATPPDLEHGPETARDAATQLIQQLLRELGVPESATEGLRLAAASAALRDLTRGYGERPEDVIGDALFDEASDEPITVRDIPFVSVCQEHLLPFHGHAHVTYLPGSAVVGLSKLARLVDVFAHRLQTPSQLANEVAYAVHDGLEARGVAVRIEARQLCPGVSGTITSSAYRGEFRLPLWRGRLEGVR